jgi:hypothetical protein
MTITFQQVEPIDESHHDKIIAAFNELFINSGGQSDGYGYGGCDYGWRDGWGDGWGNGGGDGYGGEEPEEWHVGP